MTRNAQYSLKVLMERLSTNVSMILICNYIQKIPECLRSHFIHIRFNAPPIKTVELLIWDIVKKEKATVSEQTVSAIIEAHYPDIRSMINTLQIVTGGRGTNTALKLSFDDAVDLTAVFEKRNPEESLLAVDRAIKSTCLHSRVVIRDYIKHLARNNTSLVTTAFLLNSKVVLRIPAEEENTIVSYFVRVAIPTLAFKVVTPAS